MPAWSHRPSAAGVTKGCNPPDNTTTIPKNPGDTKNCSNFATWSQAQAWFDTYYPHYSDIAKLDQDNDLIACEGLPGAP